MNDDDDRLAAIANRNRRGLVSLGVVAGASCLLGVVYFATIDFGSHAMYYSLAGLGWSAGMVGVGLRKG